MNLTGVNSNVTMSGYSWRSRAMVRKTSKSSFRTFLLTVSFSFTKYLIELARELVVFRPPLLSRKNVDASDLLPAEVPRNIFSGDEDRKAGEDLLPFARKKKVDEQRGGMRMGSALGNPNSARFFDHHRLGN